MEFIHEYDFQHIPFAEPVWNPLENMVDPYSTGYDVSQEYVLEIASRSLEILRKENLPINPLPEIIEIFGMEVGDDRVDICASATPLAIMLAVQEQVLGMKTSWKDTYISCRDWNFCEVTSSVPCAREESFEYARKTNLDNLGFVDSPTLRIIIDVQKGDRSHSSSVEGKASLLGRKLATPRTSNRSVLHIASWIQDGCLPIQNSRDPKYLHKLMGGSGCPPLWDNPDNTYLFLRAYKRGTYARVYGSAINESKMAVRDLDLGRPSTAILCNRLRDKQEYLHVTYASEVLIDQRDLVGRIDSIPVPIYKASGGSAFVQGMENRLIQSKRLVTRRQAEVEVMRSIRIATAIFGTSRVIDVAKSETIRSREARQMYEGARSANSAVQRLLSKHGNDDDATRLIREGFLSVGSGVFDISREIIEWHCLGGKGEAFRIDDIVTSEDMYIRSEVSLEEALKVGGIPLKPIFNNRSSVVKYTQARVGLWQVSKSQEEWADNVLSELLQAAQSLNRPLRPPYVLEIFERNREWISDDEILMKIALDATMGKPKSTILLYSNDFRLGRIMAQTTGWYVVNVIPIDILLAFRRDRWSIEDKEIFNEIAERLKPAISPKLPSPEIILVDYKSIAAFAMKVEEGKNPLGQNSGVLYHRKLLSSGYKQGEGRWCQLEKRLLETPFQIRMRAISPNLEVVNLRAQLGENTTNAPTGGPIGRISRLVRRFRRKF